MRRSTQEPAGLQWEKQRQRAVRTLSSVYSTVKIYSPQRGEVGFFFLLLLLFFYQLATSTAKIFTSCCLLAGETINPKPRASRAKLEPVWTTKVLQRTVPDQYTKLFFNTFLILISDLFFLSDSNFEQYIKKKNLFGSPKSFVLEPSVLGTPPKMFTLGPVPKDILLGCTFHMLRSRNKQAAHKIPRTLFELRQVEDRRERWLNMDRMLTRTKSLLL